MSDVERWSPHWDNKYGAATTIMNANGEYVLYDDYLELLDKYEELRTKLSWIEYPDRMGQ